jgi:hypothetical protein
MHAVTRSFVLTRSIKKIGWNKQVCILSQKRLRIHGTITGACGERKYTVQFDSGQIIECFSNTLRLERPTASLPPVEIQAAVAEVEAEGNHAEEAVRIIEDNEAAGKDAEVEDHLPGGTP